MAEHGPGWRRLGVLLLAALLWLLVACTPNAADVRRQADDATRTWQSPIAPRRLHEISQRLLDQRAQAILEHDRAAFMAGIDHREPAFVAEQRQFFDNVSQLPFAEFRYVVLRDYWANPDRSETVPGEVHMPWVIVHHRLRHFDPHSSAEAMIFTLVHIDGRWVVGADSDADDQLPDAGHSDPWDLVPITTLQNRRVLVIADSSDPQRARAIAAASTAAVRRVARALPAKWPRRVVVYAIEDGRVLADILDRDPDNTLAVAFPVPRYVSAWQTNKPNVTASMRVMFNPAYADSIDDNLNELLTHEITHVATSQYAGPVPLWLVEGLAEHVGHSAVPATRWTVLPSSLRRAGKSVDDLPGSSVYYTIDVGWHYEHSWMLCAYIADRYGVARLWQLYEAMAERRQVDPDIGQGRVLRRVLGLSEAQLAQAGARRLLEVFG